MLGYIVYVVMGESLTMHKVTVDTVRTSSVHEVADGPEGMSMDWFPHVECYQSGGRGTVNESPKLNKRFGQGVSQAIP